MKEALIPERCCSHTAFSSPQPQRQVNPNRLFNMGKILQAMLAFINEIPDSKFEGRIRSYTIHTDHRNLRLNNQGVSSYYLFSSSIPY